MPEHVHVHVPHELTEGNEGGSSRERTLEIVAALLMSVATLGIAWSGYQAARWSGVQSQHYTEASAARSQANKAAVKGSQERLQDLLNFNRWLEVSTEGNTQLADLYERRFREEFRPAFAAWLAQDPVNNPSAEASPLRVKEYVVADEVKSDRLEEKAAGFFDDGKEATEHADDYVFITVFFAAVLFFAGMSLRFAWLKLRAIVLGFAVVLLAYGFVRLGIMPTH
jgi:hypothetical protein